MCSLPSRGAGRYKTGRALSIHLFAFICHLSELHAVALAPWWCGNGRALFKTALKLQNMYPLLYHCLRIIWNSALVVNPPARLS